MILLQLDGAGVAYVSAFALVGIVCLLAVGRARQIQRPDVRNGLVVLLVTTSVWGLLKTAYFLLPAPYSRGAYIIGLAFGFATVWAWLYFCSAYTGRSYHRNQRFRQAGVAVFASVVAVKFTNPLHNLYFTTTEVTTPFSYLAIEHGVFHWTVTGLSYALAVIGVFMLFELYVNSGYDTRPLIGLTALISLPVVFDIAALFLSGLIEIIYAPLGVAAFALGVLYVYERRFLAVQSTDDEDDIVLFLDDDDRIRDYTPAAAALFPELAQRGDKLATVLPELAAVLDDQRQILERDVDGQRRYLLTSRSTVSLGDAGGTIVVLSDVTEAERRRRELSRHNSQLEGFASALAHELRNMLQIIEWRLGLAQDRIEEGTVEYESIGKAEEANQRLSALVDDFTSLARYGQTIEGLETVDFSPAVADAWSRADTGDLELVQETAGTVEADPGRFRELLVNAFSFARLNNADTVTVTLREDGFTISDDGDPPGEEAAGYLEFGEAIPSAEAGMKLPNAKTFAEVHDWELDVDLSYQNGVRLVISGARTSVERPEPVEA